VPEQMNSASSGCAKITITRGRMSVVASVVAVVCVVDVFAMRGEMPFCYLAGG